MDSGRPAPPFRNSATGTYVVSAFRAFIRRRDYLGAGDSCWADFAHAYQQPHADCHLIANSDANSDHYVHLDTQAQLHAPADPNSKHYPHIHAVAYDYTDLHPHPPTYA